MVNDNDACGMPDCDGYASYDLSVHEMEMPICSDCVSSLLETIAATPGGVQSIRIEGIDEYGHERVWEASRPEAPRCG